MIPPDALPIRCSTTEWGTDLVRIVAWLVEPGERVTAGEPLVELGLPGVVGEVRAEVAGRLIARCHEADEWIAREATLGWYLPDQSDEVAPQ